MPRKLGVGMPKRHKKKVQLAEPVEAVEASAGAVAVTEKDPPLSPIPTHNPSPTTAVPPSPSVRKQNVLEAAVRKAREGVRWAARGVKETEADLVLAYKTYKARNASILRASRRKHKPLGPCTCLCKHWKAETAVRMAHAVKDKCALISAEETVKLRDAQIALLRFKLRRKSRRRRVERALGIASKF